MNAGTAWIAGRTAQHELPFIFEPPVRPSKHNPVAPGKLWPGGHTSRDRRRPASFSFLPAHRWRVSGKSPQSFPSAMVRSMTLPVEEQRQARVARNLIREAGGLEPAAEHVSKGKSQLGRYQSVNEPDSITLRDIELLEAITHGKAGHPIVTRYLAQQAGYALVRLPTAVPLGNELLQLVARQAKESGDITQGVIDALEDQKIDQDEVRSLRREVAQLIDVAVAMDAHLEAFAQELT